MTTCITRRNALTIVAGGAALATGRLWAQDTSGRVIYPVAVPVYQTQFVADRIGFFKDAGLECKLIQGGSGVKTREIIPHHRVTSESVTLRIRCNSAITAAPGAC